MGLSAELGIRRHGRGVVGSSLRRVAGSKVGSRLFRTVLPVLDRVVLSLSRGRLTVSDHLAGVPTLLLTTTGAKSGKPRTAQLVAVPFGDDFAVIGSNFGNRSHPGWVHNLAAQPAGIAAHGGREVPVVARELTGSEAQQVWTEGRRIYHGFRNYPSMTDRRIRVFALSPSGG